MSSERAGTPTVGICGMQMRNTPRRNIICDLPAGHAGWHSAPDYEGMQPGVPQVVPRIDWAERAGVHTSGALNREKARDVLRELLHDLGRGPVVGAAWTEYEHWLDALEVCVVPDPRLTRIEALCAEAYHWIDGTDSTVSLHQLEAILRGDQ